MPALTRHDFIPAWTERPSREETSSWEKEPPAEKEGYQRKVDGYARLTPAIETRDLQGVNAAFEIFRGNLAQETGMVLMEKWLQEPDKEWLVTHMLSTVVPDVSVDKMVDHWRIMRHWDKLERLFAAALPLIPEQAKVWMEQCGPEHVPQAVARLRAQSVPAPEARTRTRRPRS